MEKQYSEPTLEIIELEPNEDIVTTSGEAGNANGFNGDNWTLGENDDFWK